MSSLSRVFFIENEVANSDLKLVVVGIDPKFDHKFNEKSSFSCLIEKQSHMPLDFILLHDSFHFNPLRFFPTFSISMLGLDKNIVANYMDLILL